MKSYPILCTVTRAAGHGGIARVANLLWHALQVFSDNRCQLVTLMPDGSPQPTLLDKFWFTKTVVEKQMSRKAAWIMFDHLGLARVQNFVPESLRRPYAVFLHSVEVWNPLSPGRKAVLKRARVRVANSYYTAQRVAAVHPDIGPIQVCHLALSPFGLESDGCAAASQILEKHLDTALLDQIQPNSILIVGRMEAKERHKGHYQLIEAWPLVKAHVADAQLIIVGRGDDIDCIKAKARSGAFENSILFTGHVDDDTLHAIYQRVAVFAMPSRGEGFGLVYLEAMKHSLPCIGSVYDSAREIIEDGVTGLLVDQSNVSGLAHALIGLLRDPSRRKEMGRAGFKRLQTAFSFEQFNERLHAALKPLL